MLFDNSFSFDLRHLKFVTMGGSISKQQQQKRHDDENEEQEGSAERLL